MNSITDVGGQRSQRGKWKMCFDDMKAILFCVALSEYDQFIAEDVKVNRLHESIKIFADLMIKQSEFPSVHHKPVIILFNKMDVFEAKLKRVPLSKFFPNYEGGNRRS
jgi:hypothetical protein